MLFRIPFKGRPYETQYLYIAMQILWLVKKKKRNHDPLNLTDYSPPIQQNNVLN